MLRPDWTTSARGTTPAYKDDSQDQIIRGFPEALIHRLGISIGTRLTILFGVWIRTGVDWFQIGDGYGARFEWHKGKKYTYKDAEGKEHKAKNVGTHLLVFEFSKDADGSIKRNSDGAAVGTLTLYNQNQVAAQNTEHLPEAEQLMARNTMISLSESLPFARTYESALQMQPL